MANGSIMPIPGRFLGNDSPHNFAILGDEYLEASKCLNKHFQTLAWPVYQNAFLALEQYLKSYLLSRGATIHDVRKIGHNLRAAMKKAKAKGLIVNVSAAHEDAVMGVSDYYTQHDFRYRSNGEWELVAPDVLISFVEVVRTATGGQPRLPRHVRPQAQVTELRHK
jgi:hypothetical protein